MDKTDLLSRREAHDFEAKSAQGRFGDGTVPDSVWETYAAMANTEGGLIVLGAKEKPDGTFDFIGIGDPHNLQKDFWNGVNNTQKVSANVLRNHDLQVVTIEGKEIVVIDVPRAPRHVRPVYVGSNPLTGTYRRDYEGDYRCNEPTVRRMMAEATQDSRDVRLLEGFGMDDINEASMNAYRNQFRSTKPGQVAGRC